MQSNCITVEGKKIHFQILGKGPALVLLHPSPHNSNMMLPLAKELASAYTVLCMDTPGYGRSDGFQERPNSLHDYATAMHQGLRAIGIEKASFYGSATGAQLAIRYALENPDRVQHLFLDNAAHFDDGLREAILEQYFPDLTPRIDGSHLNQLWTIVSRLFQYFPWCFNTPEYALDKPQPPKETLHFIALDFLRAGGTYDWAYHAAFEHEKASHVQQLKVPTTIFRWDGSIIAKHVDRLLSFEFPPNVDSLMITGSPADRTGTMIHHMKEKAVDGLFFEMKDSGEICPEAVAVDYRTGGEGAPMITSNGDYLQTAWNVLQTNNPSLDAKTLQQCLIHWYTT